MTLRLLPLESRDCPAGQDWYGGEVWVGTHSERVFEDYSGTLHTLDAGEMRYVAGKDGAGPRVAVFDLRTGWRDRPDFLAGDPGSRAGVAFVPTGGGAAPVYVPGVPPLSAGDPSHFKVYLAFEGDESADWVAEAFASAARLLVPAGLHLTTRRPDAPAGDYGTVVIGAPLAFHGGAVAGLAADRFGDGGGMVYQQRTVFVSPLVGSAARAGVAAAHEVGHAFGLGHRDGPRTVMSETLGGPDVDWHPDDLISLHAAASAARPR